MGSVVRHQEAAQSFEIDIDGQRCYLDYELADGVMTITHTVVPDALAGRGLAGQLTEQALDVARQRGWRVVPVCSYAAAWIERHPECADLVE
ncbi:GNAT family N-acetyltransferase [Frateuria aurantia]